MPRKMRALLSARLAAALFAGLLASCSSDEKVNPIPASPEEPDRAELDVLYIGAHPDDEAFNLATFGRWAEQQELRVGVVTLTRGEAQGDHHHGAVAHAGQSRPPPVRGPARGRGVPRGRGRRGIPGAARRGGARGVAHREDPAVVLLAAGGGEERARLRGDVYPRGSHGGDLRGVGRRAVRAPRQALDRGGARRAAHVRVAGLERVGGRSLRSGRDRL